MEKFQECEIYDKEAESWLYAEIQDVRPGDEVRCWHCKHPIATDSEGKVIEIKKVETAVQ